MIFVRYVYTMAIGWCLFLFVVCLSHKYPDFLGYIKDRASDKQFSWLFVYPLLMACFGISDRFIGQRDKE